jgi:AmiR/NasT family two-component response regulator
VVLAYTRKTQDLWRAIDTRNLIGQAQGMLMAQYKLTPDTAFAVLRRYSQATNVRLAELAEELTSTGQLPELDVLRARSDGSPHSD